MSEVSLCPCTPTPHPHASRVKVGMCKDSRSPPTPLPQPRFVLQPPLSLSPSLPPSPSPSPFLSPSPRLTNNAYHVKAGACKVFMDLGTLETEELSEQASHSGEASQEAAAERSGEGQPRRLAAAFSEDAGRRGDGELRRWTQAMGNSDPELRPWSQREEARAASRAALDAGDESTVFSATDRSLSRPTLSQVRC